MIRFFCLLVASLALFSSGCGPKGTQPIDATVSELQAFDEQQKQAEEQAEAARQAAGPNATP